MELVNYYKLLNIENTADLNTIKKAFRREIALYHPDKNKSPDSRAHFDMLVEAFDILSNTEKRLAYDAMLRTSGTNKPLIIELEKQEQYEEQYTEWKKEAKKKSETYWYKDLEDLLILDLFLSVGFDSFFDGIDSITDGLGDSIGDIFDIF